MIWWNCQSEIQQIDYFKNARIKAWCFAQRDTKSPASSIPSSFFSLLFCFCPLFFNSLPLPFSSSSNQPLTQRSSVCALPALSPFSLCCGGPAACHVIGLCRRRLFIIYHLFTLVALGKDQRSNTIILNALWCDSVICGTWFWLNVFCFSFLLGKITPLTLNLNAEGSFQGPGRRYFICNSCTFL